MGVSGVGAQAKLVERLERECDRAREAYDKAAAKADTLEKEGKVLAGSLIRWVWGALSGRSVEVVDKEYGKALKERRALYWASFRAWEIVEGYLPVKDFERVEVSKNGGWSFQKSDGSVRRLTAKEKEAVYSHAKHQLFEHHKKGEFFDKFGLQNIFLREDGEGGIEVRLGGFKQETQLPGEMSREDRILRDKRNFCSSYRRHTMAGIGAKMPGLAHFQREKSGPEFHLMHLAEWEAAQLVEYHPIGELPKDKGVPKKEGYTFIRSQPTEIKERLFKRVEDKTRWDDNYRWVTNEKSQVLGFSYSEEGVFVKNENLSRYNKLMAIVHTQRNRWEYSLGGISEPMSRRDFERGEARCLDRFMRLI